MKTLKKITTLIVLSVLPFLGAYALPGSSGTGAEDIRTIEIKGTDQMKFDVTEITAQPGEEIRIRFTTVSQIPKAAMAHNVVVLKEDTDIDAFANASAMARDNDYLAPDYKDQIIAATDLAGGGETVEVTFTVPDNPGEYEYICSFPGHFAAGMKGVLTVQQPDAR
ncbi:MAG: plastocyanin/azurin family copper-binding protein [Balneolaceae bacterium]|nr:plastocyanin/azurin family copper-binding protein [Balneolaceae bacterium]